MNVTMRLPGMIVIAVLAAPVCNPADMPKGLFHGQMVSWEGSLDQRASCWPATMRELWKPAATTALSYSGALPPAHHRRETGTRRSHRDHHRPQAGFARLLHPHAAGGSTGSSSQPREARGCGSADFRSAPWGPHDFRRHHPARCPVDHGSYTRRRADSAAAQGYSLSGRRRTAGCRALRWSTRACLCAPGRTWMVASKPIR